MPAKEITTPASAAPTPTLDRLAPPPTVPSPTQADEGAQLYWLWCQPCHGDQGQGLTDEWRAQYPPEDQNCWSSGCHGARPYENGFTLPDTVPAVVGEESLTRFNTLGELYTYIRATMPYSFPGTLSDKEYLAITAYLGRTHGVWDGRSLDELNGYEMALRPLSPSHVPQSVATATRLQAIPGVAASVMAGFIALGGIWLWRRSNR